MKRIIAMILMALSLALGACTTTVAVRPPKAGMVLVEGRWVYPPRAGATWVPGHYVWHGRHTRVWVAGHWKF